MSDTPISGSTPHNVAELGMLCRTLERLASVRLDYINQLEANNDAANAEIDRLAAKVAQLYEGAEEQKQRIKRLEEAGNNLLWNFCPEYTSDFTESQSDALKQWNKAKEAKP